LLVSAFINVIVFLLKIIGGLFFQCYMLIADGIYTLCDLITDILAMIGARIGRKSANKKYPFGYGRFEYIMQIFIGVLIFCVGIFIGIKSFFIEYTSPDMQIIYIVVLTILLKGLSSNYLLHVGKKISSLMLISSAKESFIDVLSSVMVLFFILIGQKLAWIDVIGCLLMAIIILFEGGKIIFDNVILLIGEDDNNKEVKLGLKKIVNAVENVEYADSFLLKNGEYYQATIAIAIDEVVTVKDLLKIEVKIKNSIKKSKLNVKFIDFEVIKR
ncbi:MAG: cation diffusion facilitator family transporter, partial [Bacilli bacterium]|nr:cation diffusion facilitator family transporter [Bacilli bacterium]